MDLNEGEGHVLGRLVVRTAPDHESIGSAIVYVLANCVQILGDEGALPTSDVIENEPWRRVSLIRSLDGPIFASLTRV